jgi:isopenicillin N synthase-like dioxygenase
MNPGAERAERAMVEVIKDGEVALYADYDNRFLGHGVSRAALTKVPSIDISPFLRASDAAERRSVGRAIRTAAIDIGFFYLVGHGFAEAELDLVLAQARGFFALPLADKMTVDAAKNPLRQGFVRTGGIDPDTNPDAATDIKERFFMSREVLPAEPERGRYKAGRSQWPERRLVPGFEAAMKSYIGRQLALTTALARAFALSLDLDETYFDEHYRYPGAILALNYYPPLDASTLKPTQWSFSPHTDYGTFTILLQDALGGLQVRNALGTWIDVPPVAGTFVVNLGDLFARWTNDLYASTLHRAVNLDQRARISAALFISPNGATVVRCLETCQSAGNPPRYEPVETEEYNRVLVEQSNRTGRPGLATDTAQRLQPA